MTDLNPTFTRLQHILDNQHDALILPLAVSAYTRDGHKLTPPLLDTIMHAIEEHRITPFAAHDTITQLRGILDHATNATIMPTGDDDHPIITITA